MRSSLQVRSKRRSERGDGGSLEVRFRQFSADFTLPRRVRILCEEMGFDALIITD